MIRNIETEHVSFKFILLHYSIENAGSVCISEPWKSKTKYTRKITLIYILTHMCQTAYRLKTRTWLLQNHRKCLLFYSILSEANYIPTNFSTYLGTCKLHSHKLYLLLMLKGQRLPMIKLLSQFTAWTFTIAWSYPQSCTPCIHHTLNHLRRTSDSNRYYKLWIYISEL